VLHFIKACPAVADVCQAIRPPATPPAPSIPFHSILFRFFLCANHAASLNLAAVAAFVAILLLLSRFLHFLSLSFQQLFPGKPV